MNMTEFIEDDGYYWVLAAQSVLLNNQKTLSLDANEIVELSHQIRQEADSFRKASYAIRDSAEQGPRKLQLILSSLRDEHLIQSYNEASRLDLEPDFINLLRSEIIRRGILSLVENHDEV